MWSVSNKNFAGCGGMARKIIAKKSAIKWLTGAELTVLLTNMWERTSSSLAKIAFNVTVRFRPRPNWSDAGARTPRRWPPRGLTPTGHRGYGWLPQRARITSRKGSREISSISAGLLRLQSNTAIFILILWNHLCTSSGYTCPLEISNKMYDNIAKVFWKRAFEFDYQIN